MLLRCKKLSLTALIALVLSGIPVAAWAQEAETEEHEESAVMVVRDRGNGIPPIEMERVRKAFYTRRRGGTGLGLAIAERFVQAQGGRIELENLDPHGFEARVVLPIDDDPVKIGG